MEVRARERANLNGPPVEIVEANGDLGSGTMAAMSIIAALWYRAKKGIARASQFISMKKDSK